MSKKQRGKAKEKVVQKKKYKILASAHKTEITGNPPKETDLKKEQRTDWVLFYKKSENKFPNDLADKILKSGTNSGIINSKKTLTVGDGLKFMRDGEEIELDKKQLEFVGDINSRGWTLEEAYEKAAFSWIAFGTVNIRGVRFEGGINYFHEDPTQVRVSPFNKKNLIETAFISPDWQSIKNSTSLESEQDERMRRIPMFDGSEKQEEFIIRITRDFPGLDYYGLPDYIAAVISGWVDINYRIGKFNIDDLDNGLMPSALIQLIGEPPEGQTAKEYVEFIRNTFTGEGKNGKMLIELLDSPEQAAKLQLFENVQEGHFEGLDKMADQALVTAHGWYRSLTGLSEPGALGNNQQLKNEFDYAMNMKVIPDYRRPLNRFFNKLLKMAGQDFQIGVVNLQPLSLASDIEVNKCLTVGEGRDILGFAPLEDDKKNDQLIDLEDREPNGLTTTSNNGVAVNAN